ncbi:MAG: hypothetical protein LUD47_03195, partial [Clostridia bacterium]|nr:hypothetical protein [Clostridia bacterium]
EGASFNAEGGDVAGSVTFDGCEDASVDMDGGTVTSTGSVEFTGSTGASFNAEGGDINGSVSFTECGDASVSMGSEDAEGGNINGSVTFGDSENASLDMDGGNVAEGGSVSFDGCENAKFDLDDGEMNGTVTFTGSDSAEFDLGGGTVGESGEVNFNQSEDAVMDLGDGTFSGTMNAAEGSFVEITGSGDATEGTFFTDDASSLELHGGTYDKDTFDEYFDEEENEDYRAVENADGSCTVMTKDEFIENASVTVTYQDDKGNTFVEHFSTVEDALDFITKIDNAPGIVVTLEDNYSGSIEFSTAGNVTFDLSGHDVEGDISITGGGTLTIIDQEGGARVGGEVEADGDSDIVVEGGTYSSESVFTYVDDEYVVVVGHDDDGKAAYTVMTEGEAIGNSYVYVETCDEETGTTTKQYYETLEDAMESADGETIVLTGDLDVSDRTIEITSETVIDTDGHSLAGDFVVVVADDCGADGSLTVKDSSEDGSGSFTGKVTVEDRSTGASGEGESEDGYSDAFTLEDGLTPDGIDIDLSNLNGDGSYHFETVTDDDGNTSYGIVSGGSHSFAIPVWSVSEDGTITLELMCECGEYLTDENGDGVVFVLTDAAVEETEEGLLHVTGTIEVKYTYVNENGSVVDVTESYDCDMYLEGVAATVVTDDGTIYFFFDGDEQNGVQSAVDFAKTHGGYVTLYEDASDIHINVETQTAETTTEYYEPLYDENGEVLRDEDGNIIYSDTPTVETTEETVYTDVVIDLNGHNLEIGIQADKGNSVTLTDTAEERGNADVGLSVDGVVIFDDVNITMCENVVEDDTDVNGEIWIRGDTTIDLNGMTIFNVDEIEGNLTLTGGDGSVLKLGDDIDLTDGSITIDGAAGIDLGGNDLTTDILVTEGSSFDLNLNGATFSGNIELEDDASLTIRDSSVSRTGDMEGTVTAEGSADVEIHNGVYDPRDEDSGLILDLGDDTVIQSATDASGETYYETVSSAEHNSRGHGYDIFTGWTFNAESSTITLYYECLCGETSVRNIVISEDDYTTEVTEDGTVTVSCSVSGIVVAPNGSSYEYSVAGTFELDYAISEGESANGYVYAVREVADCYGTGLDTYTYGDGRGIVVKVVTPVTHRGLTDIVGEDGNTYHLCEICESFVTDANSDAGYAELGDLVEDVGLQNTYNDEKQAALDELESWKDEIINGIDPETPGYDNVIAKIEEIFEELKEEISGMDYEAQTEAPEGAEDGWRSEYAGALTEALEDALSDAMLEVEKTANQEVSRNILEDVYNDLYDSGKYSDEALDELKGEFDAAMADLEEITVTSEDDLAALYDEYLQRVLAALYAIKIDVALTTDDSAYGGSVTSTEGLDSGVELVITDMGTAGYTFTTDAELIYKGSRGYTEDEVADLVEGKGIVAVFDISLVNSADGTEVYVFSGYYVVRINDLPESILAYDGLQIVFVGDDGRVEIYDTDVHADEGYLEFTTTHFSEYMILGIGAPLSAVEKETDLTAAIIALAVVAGVLL